MEGSGSCRTRQDGRFSSFLLTDEAYARAQIAGLREADQRKTAAN